MTRLHFCYKKHAPAMLSLSDVALESCRDYLHLIATRGLDADLAAKGGASDLVQETLLGAYRDFGAFHGRSREELLAWLRKILQNNLAVHRRRYRDTRQAAGFPGDSAGWLERWRATQRFALRYTDAGRCRRA